MRKYKISLSQNDIQKTIASLETYKKSLPDKMKLFCDRLSDYGISIAKTTLQSANAESMSNLIMFRKEFETANLECKEILIMYDQHPAYQQWLGVDENGDEIIKTAEISPTLMYEFGSGKYADSSHAMFLNAQVEVGKGTFPSQRNKPVGNDNHANDTWESWIWKGLDNEWHRSRGMKPKMPLFNAYLGMKNEIKSIAKEVFNG